MFVYKDYQVEDKMLQKHHVKEKKHLLWKYGGVPAIDAKVWNEWGDEVEGIYITTDKGRHFLIDDKTFNNHKQLINLGFGEQFIVPKEQWKIE